MPAGLITALNTSIQEHGGKNGETEIQVQIKLKTDVNGLYLSCGFILILLNI